MRGLKMRRNGSMISVVLIAVLLLGSTLILVSPQSRAEINPPVLVGPDTWLVAGDWVIENGDNIVHQDKTIFVEGDLVIQNGGTLSLYNVTLQLNSTFSGQYHIEVQNGGAFYVYDGGDGLSIWDPADTDWSILRGANFGLEMQFWVRPTGTFVIDNSSMGFIGEAGPAWPLPTLEPWGLFTQSDNTILRNTWLVFSGGLIADDSSPEIYDSAFIFDQFGVASYNLGNPHLYNVTMGLINYPAIYADASSVYVDRGDVSQAGGAGHPAVYITDGSVADISRLQVHDNVNGGIVVMNSHLNLYDSNVTNNGANGLTMIENLGALFTSNVMNSTFSLHTNSEVLVVADGDVDVTIEENVVRAEPGSLGVAVIANNLDIIAAINRNNITNGDAGILAVAMGGVSVDMSENWVQGQTTVGVQVLAQTGSASVTFVNNTLLLTERGAFFVAPNGDMKVTASGNDILGTNDLGVYALTLGPLLADFQDNDFTAIGIAPTAQPIAIYAESTADDVTANILRNTFLAISDSAVYVMAAGNLDLTLESNECLMCAMAPTFSDSAFVFQSGLDTTAYVYNNTIDMTSFGSGIYLMASGPNADLQFIENRISATEFVGINVMLLSVFDVLFESNYVSFSQGAGVLLTLATSGNVVMANNTLSRHDFFGAAITTGPDVIGVTLNNNLFIANGAAGLYLMNADLASQGNEFIANQWGAEFTLCTGTMEDEQFLYNDFGAHIDATSQLEVINSTMDSASLDFLVENDSHLTLLNTTHDDFFGIWIAGPLSTATVKWFLHVLVETEQGVPVSGASVSVDDVLGTTLASGFTGADGMIRWLVVNESYQIGMTKTLYTPHNITASGAGFGTGYADPVMDMSKTVPVVLTDIQPPVAVANNDIVDEDRTINLDSTGSSDNVGIVNWTWVVSDVGGDVTVYGEFAPYIFAQPGIFTVTLTVWDAAGLSDMDTATITVLDVTAPVADAGPDQQVNSTDLVDFDGTLSTDNVGIVNYTWTFTYDASSEEIWGVTPNYTFVTPGVYTVTLNATDAAGNSGYDTVVITVVDNEDPVANAGDDQLDNDEGSTIHFDGTASTDNVGIVSYEWEFDYEGNTITLDGSSPSFTFTQVGDYVVTLTVMDGEGNFDTDTMTVSIADSTPPEVVATSPDDGATGVSIETEYVITFSEPMDTAVTENAITVDGATIEDFDWNSDDTQVTITLSELEHDKEYTVLVTDDATDVAGNALNDETFTFRTQAPPPLFDLANDFYWLIIVIILVVIMIILALRKRKVPEAAPTVYEPVGYEEAPPAEQYPPEETYEAPPEEPMEPMPEEAPEDMPPEEPELEESPEEPGEPPEEPEE